MRANATLLTAIVIKVMNRQRIVCEQVLIAITFGASHAFGVGQSTHDSSPFRVVVSHPGSCSDDDYKLHKTVAYSLRVEIDPQRLAELGARLRRLREDRAETQINVAQAVGLHRTYLGRLEAGKKNITVGVLYRLADHFGVAAATLLPD